VIWPLAPSCVEGALARVSGLERSENPYDTVNASERHGTWLWAWLYADKLLEINIEHQTAGWFNSEEAA
jgi:hypothetical protein